MQQISDLSVLARPGELPDLRGRDSDSLPVLFSAEPQKLVVLFF